MILRSGDDCVKRRRIRRRRLSARVSRGSAGGLARPFARYPLRVSKPPPTPVVPRALRVLGGASRWLALARDVAMAAFFRRDETDAFFVAFTIPSALAQMIGDGAVARAVAPVLEKKMKREGDAAALVAFHRLRGAFGAALFLVTNARVVFAGPLTDLLAAQLPEAGAARLSRTVPSPGDLLPRSDRSAWPSCGRRRSPEPQRWAAMRSRRFGSGAPQRRFPHGDRHPPQSARRARPRRDADACRRARLVGSALQVMAVQRHICFAGPAGGGRAVVDLRDPALRDVARRIAPLILGIGIYYVANGRCSAPAPLRPSPSERRTGSRGRCESAK